MKTLVFGEVLWDIFESEKKIGGAPLNFAAHLVKNGVQSFLYTSVGNDDLGTEALKTIADLGVNTKYVSTVRGLTGACLVTLKDGLPVYQIKQDTAMDKISKQDVGEEFEGFYFGTLAQRSPVSKAALVEILNKKTFLEKFLDINIRQNYRDADMIDFSLKNCTILKVSREEIGVLSNIPLKSEADYKRLCEELYKKYPNIKIMIITLDSDGAFVCDFVNGKQYLHKAPNVKIISTVGAGDSFSAAFFSSYLNGASIEDCLKRATDVAGFVITRLEAVPDYPAGLV